MTKFPMLHSQKNSDSNQPQSTTTSQPRGATSAASCWKSFERRREMKWLSDDKLDHLLDVVGARYEFVKELGRGGMGTVYLAEDRELDRQVAIKVLNAPEATDGLRERMIREAQIIARLEHPGIVPVHDVGTLPDGRIFYAMEFVRGN